MEATSYLSTVILVATVATVILAVFSYAAFKMRERRRPGREEVVTFFRRYQPPGAPSPGGGSADRD